MIGPLSRPPVGHFGFSRRYGVAGGERTPPVPLFLNLRLSSFNFMVVYIDTRGRHCSRWLLGGRLATTSGVNILQKWVKLFPDGHFHAHKLFPEMMSESRLFKGYI